MNKEVKATMNTFLAMVAESKGALDVPEGEVVNDAILLLKEHQRNIQLVAKAHYVMEDLTVYLMDMGKDGLKALDKDKIINLMNELDRALVTKD